MPFPRYLVEGSPYARHTPQTIIPGKVNIEDPDKNKKPRLCWDGTTKVHWWETTMNEVTPTEGEAEITLGYVHMAFCIWIVNLQHGKHS